MMDALVTAALLGTAQRGGGEVPAGAPVDGLIEQVESGEVERRLLLRAGALATFRSAGAVPLVGIAEQEAAHAETLPACSPLAATLIQSLLSGTYPELLPEALERLQRAGLRLPFDVLPLALSAREHHAALAPVLGERGRWLSRFNPAWAWARSASMNDTEPLPGNAETIWQEGAPGERVALLRRLRASEPERARQWLMEVWKREKAEMRADLLSALEVGLTVDDEAFLEAALDDRGAAVRERAALLLAHLPDSALTGRMIERAEGVLRYAAGTLTVRPPKEFAKSAVRDGLAEKPPVGVGERAWWMLQYMSRAPLSHWQEFFGATPDELIAAAKSTQWMWPVLEGWSRAYLLFGGDAWILPLWQAWSVPPQKGTERQKYRYDEIRTALAPHVPRDELEHLALALVEGRRDDFPMTMREILAVLPRPWSADLGASYLRGLRSFVSELTATSKNLASWDDTLEAATLGLPPECFAAALEPFSLPDGDGSWYLRQFRRQLDEFAGAIQMRQRLIEEILP